MFENKKIFILGLARSGYEAAKVLIKLNNEVIINEKYIMKGNLARVAIPRKNELIMTYDNRFCIAHSR